MNGRNEGSGTYWVAVLIVVFVVVCWLRYGLSPGEWPRDIGKDTGSAIKSLATDK